MLVAVALRSTSLGKELRALSDNMALAEVSGIDTVKSVRITWAVAGALAGLAGILYAAAIGSINPNFGITILLSLFASAVLGGIGNAYGALAGGIVLGLSQEWSTLVSRRASRSRSVSRYSSASSRSARDCSDEPGRPIDNASTSGAFRRFLRNTEFWVGVGVLAATYRDLRARVQLNVGTTGIVNFGQAGFMPVGATRWGSSPIRGA